MKISSVCRRARSWLARHPLVTAS
jgi:hypothetical protein